MTYLPHRKKGLAPMQTQEVLFAPAQLDMIGRNMVPSQRSTSHDVPFEQSLERYLRRNTDIAVLPIDQLVKNFTLESNYRLAAVICRSAHYEFLQFETRSLLEDIIAKRTLGYHEVDSALRFLYTKRDSLRAFLEGFHHVKHNIA